MRTLTSGLETLAQKTHGTEPINILKVEWSGGTKYYADKSIGSGDGSSAANAIGCIESLSPINSQLDSLNLAHKDNFTTTLIEDSSNTRFLTLLQTEKIYNVNCTLYQGFEDTSDTLEIFKGEITSPVSWNEEEKTLSFTIASPLDESEIGFSTNSDEFEYGGDLIDGRMWPIAFGKVLKIPALKVGGLLSGSLAEPIDSSDLPNTTVKVENGDEFPQNESLNLKIDGLAFTGSFSDNDLTITTDLVAKYTNVAIGARESLDDGENNYKYLWITQTEYDNGVRLQGMWMVKGDYINYCISQVGTKCRFKFAWPDTYSSGSIDEVSPYDLDWGWKKVGYWWGWSLVDRYVKAEADWKIESGSKVYISGHNEDVEYIVNTIGGGTIKAVQAYRSIDDDKDMLVDVPSSYYSTSTSYDSTSLFSSPPDDVPTNCVSISMTKELNYYEGENWQPDVIYVSLECSQTGNAADIISYLLTNYTDLTPDTTTFNAVSTLLADVPVSFALLEKKNVLQLCRELAFQSGCALMVNNSTVKIKAIFNDPGTPSLTIYDSDIELDTIRIGQTPYLDIVTSMKSEYRKNYADEVLSVETENNIANFGKIESVENFWSFNIKELVSEFSTFWLNRFSNSWRIIEFETYLNSVALEIFDFFNLSITDDLLGTGTIKCMIKNIHFNTDTDRIKIKAWLPVEAGTVIESSEAFATLTGTTIDPLSGLSMIDYIVDVKPLEEKDYVHKTDNYDWEDDEDTEPFQVKYAQCNADAGASGSIECTLYNDDGTLSSQIITVACKVFGTGFLEDCIPLLSSGDNIPVFYYDGTWYCYYPFQTIGDGLEVDDDNDLILKINTDHFSIVDGALNSGLSECSE